ncbi:MAG: aminoacyl-tRNA hydrolase [Hyphomicrobiales bacterium]|nr:MAG: aminoacyl-tRNA hydrolase [Hyphomicrobiales bacterium]
MIKITDHIELDPAELNEQFIRSSGPGGQNVNKVSTAVQLHFDIRRSPSLPQYVRDRAEQLAGQRLSKSGVIVITANRHRTQELNRTDATARLVALLKDACYRKPIRRPTKPTLGSKRRRMDSKTKRGAVKKLRSGKPSFD